MNFRTTFIALTLIAIATSAHAETDNSLAGNYLAGRTAARLRDPVAASNFFEAALGQDPENSVLIE